MSPIADPVAAAGWTDFAAVFSTVFPLLVFIAIFVWYVAVARRYP